MRYHGYNLALTEHVGYVMEYDTIVMLEFKVAVS